MNAPITFRPVTEGDMPLLHAWHQRPHVAEWWQPVPSIDELRADYLSHPVDPDVKPLDTPAGALYYLACENGVPFGYIQVYHVMTSQESGWWLDETDPHALGIDQFIADADRLGKGLGTRMIRAFLDTLFADPRVTKVQTDPSPTNPRAVACYRKAGFRDVGVVDTPDGPALLMRVLRADRQS
ncbi:GNAT family N-acetyltransferase [Polyangium aurulentum]|uniref:GNAT family N-acetyltransferase n=1 Tax=Polyangium aurulentum TaxID=2567896 RepID=UPI0010AE1BBE|nr:GNAT family N-acetyltransferase [Polyangium aurulentum]UQA54913.1 GNAT family N-acetyltransferase [Polyangium aurulentum]